MLSELMIMSIRRVFLSGGLVSILVQKLLSLLFIRIGCVALPRSLSVTDAYYSTIIVTHLVFRGGESLEDSVQSGFVSFNFSLGVEKFAKCVVQFFHVLSGARVNYASVPIDTYFPPCCSHLFGSLRQDSR